MKKIITTFLLVAISPLTTYAFLPLVSNIVPGGMNGIMQQQLENKILAERAAQYAEIQQERIAIMQQQREMMARENYEAQQR